MLPSEFLCILYSALCHIAEKGLVCIVAGTLGNLENNRRLGLGRSLDNGLELLHVVEIEGRDCITSLYCLCKHFPGVYKAQIFIRNHIL